MAKNLQNNTKNKNTFKLFYSFKGAFMKQIIRKFFFILIAACLVTGSGFSFQPLLNSELAKLAPRIQQPMIHSNQFSYMVEEEMGSCEFIPEYPMICIMFA